MGQLDPWFRRIYAEWLREQGLDAATSDTMIRRAMRRCADDLHEQAKQLQPGKHQQADRARFERLMGFAKD